MIIDICVGSDWRDLKSSRVVGKVNAARKFRKFTDVAFIVGPDEDACSIKAHRVVLGTANDEFANLLSGSNNPDWIRITDVSPIGFKNMIRYFYDADVKFTDLSSVRETYLVAEKFKVHKLKLAAENCLNYAINYESILEMLQISIEFDMPELRGRCIYTISTKYQDVLKSEELISAPFEVVEAVLSNPCHGEDCQYHALEAISKWKKKHETDQKQLENLLKCVDFAQVRMCFFNDFFQENPGILSNVDFRAFQKYILTKVVDNAPEWYQSEKFPFERNYKTNIEALKEDTSEMKFPEYMEKQKLEVQKALDQELYYIEKTIMEAAEISMDFYEISIRETAKGIIEYFSDMIKEAVETSVESVEDDMKHLARVKEETKKENIKFADGEKESDARMEVASASDIDTLPKTEYDSTKGSGTLLTCTDSVEASETENVKQGATSLLTERH